jgi:hypothetical protein
MPVSYSVKGPFSLPFKRTGKVKILERKDVKGCLAEWEDERGCYVFALRGSHGSIVPFYVGKTAKSFASECFTDHKLNKYNAVLHKHTHGAPIMLLVVAKTGERGAFNKTALRALEEYLIGLGLQANPDIKNISGTKRFEPPFNIEKIHTLSRGSIPASVKAFKRAFEIR